VRDKLVGIFGPERVITEPEQLHEYHDDLTEIAGQDPAAVVFPTATEEIQALVKLARELGSSITPRVANTNVGGLAIAAKGGIIADLTRMNRIVEVDADEMVAVIEPGVTQQQLKDHLVEGGLPLTLGFSLAPPYVSILANCLLDGLTNRSLKYGSMAQWINGLEVVLGDGEVMRTGSWSIRGVGPFARAPMPDLTGMFTSFQGTTGIVTKMAFQLWPKHPIEKRLFVLGYSAKGVFGAVQKLCRLEICEDIGGLSWPSGKMMMGVQYPNPIPDPDEPKWFLYVDLAAELTEEMAYKERLFNAVLEEQRAAGERLEKPLDVLTLVKVNPSMSSFAEFPTELTFLTDHGGGGLSWMGTYGPLSRFAATADACSEIMVRHDYAPAIVSRPMRGGHFGVLRFLVTFDKSSPTEVERVRALMRDLLEAIAEAGFAMYKTPAWALDWLRDRMDARALQLIRDLKQLTDPHRVLNPGKWDI
jgi:glycolate oxidase